MKMRYTLKCSLLMMTTLFLAAPVFAQPKTDPYPGLEMNGNTYPNACSPKQRALRKELKPESVSDPTQAWQVVEALLCAPDDKDNRRRLLSYTAPEVRVEQPPIEEKPIFHTVKRSEALVGEVMAKGRAWDAELSPEGTQVVLHYVADEACVKGLTLAYRASRWLVTETSEACD